MQYKWKGDNKLCIPGLSKIGPGAVFEMDEEHLKNAGVKQLMKQGLIVPVEPTATDAEAGAGPGQIESSLESIVPQGPAEIPESQEPQELQKPGKDRRRR